MGLGDRFGRFDDESVIYRADDPEQKVHWWRLAFSYVVGSLLATAVIVGLGALVGEGLAIAVLLVAAVAFVVAHVIWRRRRNRRLIGSPTTWSS